MLINLLDYFDAEIKSVCANTKGLKDRDDVKKILEALQRTKELAHSGLEEPSPDNSEAVLNGLSEILDLSQKYFDALDPVKNPGEKSVAAELAALKKPFTFYRDSLQNGKNVEEALSDLSWIKGYFGEAQGFEDRADYVPGQYKAGTLKSSADDYRNALNGMKQNYYANLSSMTGYDKASEEIFVSQAYMLQAIIDELDIEAETRPFEDAVRGHRFVWQTANIQRIEALDPDKMICSQFIDFILDEQANKLISANVFEKIEKDSPQYADTIKDLQAECFKLYFTRSDKVVADGVETKVRRDLTGATKEQREIMDGSSYSLQLVNFTYSKLANLGGIDDDDSILKKSYEAIRDLNNRIFAYVKGDEGATMPTEQELTAFADVLIENFDEISDDFMFTDKGFDENVLYSPSLLRDMAKYEPCLEEKSRVLTEKVRKAADKVHDRLLTDAVKTKYDPGNDSLDKLDDDFYKLHTFEQHGLGSHDQYICDKFIKMASDPAYNKYMVEKAKEAIATYAIPNKTVSTQPGGFVVASSPSDVYKNEDVYAAAYKVYILGTALEREHQMIADIKRGVKNVQKPKSEIMDLVTKKNVTVRDINNVKKLYDSFSKTGLNKALTSIAPADFVRVMNGQAEISEVAGVDLEKTDMISRMDSRIIKSLTQRSGNFYSSNSKEYSDIGDALRVLEDKARVKAQTKEDYLKLFEASAKYMMTHDSSPASRNGQLRFDSAAKLTALIANKVRKDYPQYMGTMDSFIEINMARSRVFRDEYVAVCRNGIKAVLGEGDMGENYSKLPLDPASTRRDIRHNARFILYGAALEEDLGAGRFISGKAKTVEQQMAVLDQCENTIAKTDRLYEVFRKDPASHLEHLCDPAKTKDAVGDLRLEHETLQIEPVKL